MKKLLPKLALALMPALLYLCIFAAFEPNNYFGLHPDSSTSQNSPIARLRAYEAAPQTAVILGDSRMAHFDMALVEDTAGRPYANVAYGGASLEESIDEFFYLVRQYPEIDHVVFGLSFYTLNSAYRPANRMATVETQLADPSAYLFNLEYNINTLTNLSNTLQGTADAVNRETAQHFAAQYNSTVNGTAIRGDLVAYAASLYANCSENLNLPAAQVEGDNAAAGVVTNAGDILAVLETASPKNSKFSINEKAVARLYEMIDYCNEHDITLTLVFPPMDASVRTLVCNPLGISDAMLQFVSQLKTCDATVLDYEWTAVPDYPDTMFYDGFHLDIETGLPVWTQKLFSEVA